MRICEYDRNRSHLLIRQNTSTAGEQTVLGVSPDMGNGSGSGWTLPPAPNGELELYDWKGEFYARAHGSNVGDVAITVVEAFFPK